MYNRNYYAQVDGAMMKLVKYNLVGGTETSEANTADLVHNHKLTPETPEG